MFGKKMKKNHPGVDPAVSENGSERIPERGPVADAQEMDQGEITPPVQEAVPEQTPAPVVFQERKVQYDLMPLAVKLDERVDHIGGLLGALPISESEFFGLVDYMQCTFPRLLRQADPEPDLLFTVGLVQCCIRFYNGQLSSIVNRIARMLQVGDRLTPQMLQKLSLMVIATLEAYEKPYRMDGHLPKNLLMHAFITDKDAFNLFEYLLLFYQRELEADMRRLDDGMLNALCRSMIRPLERYAHLLSKHFTDSIKSDAYSCKKMLRLFLRLIDCDFYGHPLLKDDPDRGRLRSIYERWKKTSPAYPVLMEEGRRRICDEGVRPEDKREPYLLCDPHTGALKVVIPSQLVLTDPEENQEVRWYVSAERTRAIPCTLQESVIGSRTQEIVLPISVKESLQHLTFVLMCGQRKICRFSWPGRFMNFFNEDGRGIRIRRLTPGKRFAFGDPSVDVSASCPVSEEKVNGYRFFHMELKEGDIVSAGDPFSLYVGSIEKNELTSSLLKYTCSACFSEGERIGVYDQVPSLACIVKEGDLLNTNGRETSAEMEDTVQVLSDSRDVLSLLKTQVPVKGMNRVLLKGADGSVKTSRKFVLFQDFSVDFEGSPYAESGKGKMILNRPMKDGILMIDEEEIRTDFEFDLSKCVSQRALHIPAKSGEEVFDLEIRIPYMKQLWNG